MFWAHSRTIHPTFRAPSYAIIAACTRFRTSSLIRIFATGHEYRYGTIQPTLTAVPQRTRLLAAKVTVVAAVAFAVAVVSLAADVAAGWAVGCSVPDLTIAPMGEVLPGYLLLVVLWAVAGVALGQLFRSVPAPLVVILVMPLLPALDWLRPVVRFLPFTAGQQLIGVAGEASGGDATEVSLFHRWPSGGVFAVAVVRALVAAGILFRRRDA